MTSEILRAEQSLKMTNVVCKQHVVIDLHARDDLLVSLFVNRQRNQFIEIKIRIVSIFLSNHIQQAREIAHSIHHRDRAIEVLSIDIQTKNEQMRESLARFQLLNFVHDHTKKYVETV